MRRPLAPDRLEFDRAVIHQSLCKALGCHIHAGDRVTKAKVARHTHYAGREEAFALRRQGRFGTIVDDDFSSGFESIANPALAAWQPGWGWWVDMRPDPV